MTDPVCGKDSFYLGKGGLHTAKGDPEVVQELRIQVVSDAAFVRLHHVEKMQVNFPGSFAGAHSRTNTVVFS